MTQLLFDGRKSISLDLLNGDAGWTTLGNSTPITDDVRVYYERVGLLYRCVNIRANSLSKVPWVIANDAGETVWKKGDTPPVDLAFLEPLPRLLYKTEAALTLGSQAFWHKERNRVRTLGLRWFAPIATAPWWDVERGLTHFVHRTGVRIEEYPVDEIVYLWHQHPLHETARDVSAAEAAMAAAGVLYNVDAFAAAFFERGAIKATLLTVQGNPPKTEMDRLKAWWNRVMVGMKNAFGAQVVNADSIKPVVIGEGISELSNSELTSEKARAVVYTLGVPFSMIFSDAANYATAQQDEQNFYNSTIIPECELIADQLGEQLLDAYGYHLVFKPETMDVFQTDEKERADSYVAYVGAGMPPPLVAEMLGIDLPDGWAYDDLEKEEPVIGPPTEDMSPNNAPMVDNVEEEPAKSSERRRFRAWARKRRDPDPADFHSRLLSDGEKAAMLDEMGGGADQPFFTGTLTLPSGAITPEWVKAMVLQLDRDDDEAERAMRLSLDRRTSRSLTQVFNDMLDTLYPEGYGEFQDPNIEAQRVRRMFEEEQKLYDTLSRALQDGTDLGVSVAVTGLENTGYSFDYTMANVEAREWASRYTGELIRGISDTTQSGVRQAVARFIDNSEPLETLIDDLRPYFSRARAERIAITEVTRAYQQGSESAWRASGVVGEMEWVTNRDELVCVKCGPMDRKRAPLGSTFEGGIAAPPRHVRCRCFTRPVVKEPSE